MARRPPAQEVMPDDFVPVQAVPDPILNGPYDEPRAHWKYKGGVPFQVPERRPAMYFYRSQKVGSLQQDLLSEEQGDNLELVNRLRDDVRRWREAKYRGASQATKDLFAYWFRDDRQRRLFFCQREAIETLVYLLELAIPGNLFATGYKKFSVDAALLGTLLRGERPPFAAKGDDNYPRLCDIPADERMLPLRRLGCKMATGSGKTLVMAMLITWAFVNRGKNPQSTHFPSAVLVCAPNLTVKKRLQVLRPDHPDNYYAAFDLCPASYRVQLGMGKVLVQNWHAFAPKSEHREGDRSYVVVQKGEETADAFTRDRLGELAARLPILVLNDEGHHCWRPKAGTRPEAQVAQAALAEDLTTEQKKDLEEEAEEARIWLAGLDRINNSGLLGTGPGGRPIPGVLATIDLSATPFYLANSGFPMGSPFPWLVSDFGLVDAIESGIVKIPRLPVDDDKGKKDEAGRPDPKYFRLWRHIMAKIKTGGKRKRPDPKRVYEEAESALTTLHGQWYKEFQGTQAATPGARAIPPVLIVVCDDTEIAKYFYQMISGERVVKKKNAEGKEVEVTVCEGSKFAGLANEEGKRRVTIRIDTKLLASLETEEDQTRDQAAALLREIIDTVGKPGGPGEQVRCVVSVSMLTEGWDACNVRHILGVRAFDSQLLCEQVVGRGLRRTDYSVDPQTGRLPAQHVDVYGIPFSLIPYKGQPKDVPPPPDRPVNRVFAVPDKEHLRITIPVVEGYTYALRESGIRCDVDSLEELLVTEEPSCVYLIQTRGYETEGAAIQPLEYIEQDRQAFYATIRTQQIVFRLAWLIMNDLLQGQAAAGQEGAFSARHQLFPEIVRIVKEYIGKKVRFAPGVDERELAHEKYAQRLRERIRAGILPAAASADAPLLPVLNTFQEEISTDGVDYQTVAPIYRLGKSHLNAAVVRSVGKGGDIGEVSAIDVLEDMDSVLSYTPNDRRIGFQIPWEYDGEQHRYEPDFIVQLRGPSGGPGTKVILEIKGGGGEVHAPDLVKAKNAAAAQWVSAINNARRFGVWAFVICRDLKDLRPLLERHAVAAEVRPFQSVALRPGEQFRTCVPLLSLRAVAARAQTAQGRLDPLIDAAAEWVSWAGAPAFVRGMFVARVAGRAMAPRVPDGAYCLFQPPRPGPLEGRVVLAYHPSINDVETGGGYTLRVYGSAPAEEGRRRRVILRPEGSGETFTVTVEKEDEVRVIAELALVLGGGRG